MERRIAIFAFNGDPMSFVHTLMNCLDMNEKGVDVKLIIEGSATALIKEAMAGERPFTELYKKVRDSGLIDCVCKACATKMGSLESAKEQNLKLCDEMSGHPSMAKYLEEGYEIVLF